MQEVRPTARKIAAAIRCKSFAARPDLTELAHREKGDLRPEMPERSETPDVPACDDVIQLLAVALHNTLFNTANFLVWK